MNAVTELLSAAEQGEPLAPERLLPLVYAELRSLAAARLRQESAGQTLQATALVHEAYLRLVQGESAENWNSRAHFFGAAAEAMRRIVIERARQKKTLKHGGSFQQITLSGMPAVKRDEDLLALNDALDRLEAEDPVAAQVVKLRFFAGLSHEDIAAVLDATVYFTRQKWNYARAWLRTAIHAE